MTVTALNHLTIRCKPSELPALHHFYVEVIGLRPGWRPPFTFDGYWMYPPAGEVAAVHIAATLSESLSDERRDTGRLDHFSLSSTGLQQAKDHLDTMKVPFAAVPVPGSRLMQLFLNDPLGVKIELTFDNEH